MTGMAACITGDRSEPLAFGAVARVVLKRPGAIERRGSEIAWVPPHHIARGVAHAAADAFDRGIDRAPLRRCWLDPREIVAPRRRRLELASGLCPLIEETAHVGDEIANDRQVRERRDPHRVAPRHFRDMCTARPPGRSIDRHRA